MREAKTLYPCKTTPKTKGKFVKHYSNLCSKQNTKQQQLPLKIPQRLSQLVGEQIKYLQIDKNSIQYRTILGQRFADSKFKK